MKTKEKIREALEESRWSAVKKMMQGEAVPYSESITEAQTNAIMELMPKWYKTSTDFPGDMEVKKCPKNCTEFIGIWDGLRTIAKYNKETNCIMDTGGSWQDYDEPDYWYPVEPLKLHP